MSLDDALGALSGRSTSSLLPTEVILALVEKENIKKRAQGDIHQWFSEKSGPSVLFHLFQGDHGISQRPGLLRFHRSAGTDHGREDEIWVICPVCKTPRNLKLLRTKDVEYESKENKFYLICDNPSCGHQRMVPKEGDELGIEAIRDRIEVDGKVMRTLLDLQGIQNSFKKRRPSLGRQGIRG